MQPYSVERSIVEGELEVKELFEYAQNNAGQFEAYEMEKAVFARLMRIGLAAMKCYFAEKGTGDVGVELQLENGKVLKKETLLHGRDYFSVFGKIKVPRTCYRIEGEKGVMPLDAQANLPERCYSYLLQEWMGLFGIRESFGEAAISLKNPLGLDIKQSRFEVVDRESINDYDEFYKNKELPAAKSEGELQVMSFDGKGVPVIKKEAAKIQARLGKGEKRQKKKEAMVGVDYTIDRKVCTPEEVAENLVYPEQARKKREEKRKEGVNAPTIRAKNVRRLASLERSKRQVVDEIVSDARHRDPDNKRPLVVVMDGALCLWNLLISILAGLNWVGILDIIHVVEYLWKAGNALHGERTPEARKWVYEHLLSTLQGRIGSVIGGLKQTLTKRKLKVGQRKALKEAITYFENHREWMRYDEYLRAGYPIGSGVVESTCGHTVKKRMEGTGRRWSIKGAESTLLLRSIYTSDDWNAYWQAHMHLERTKSYDNILKAVGYPHDYCDKKAA